MAKFVAFLRGMNLGGRRISNPDLCAAFDALGFSDVAAFLASGNVVFSATGTPTAIRSRLESGLAEQLGYPVPSFVRTAARVRALAELRPFADRRASNPRGKPQVIFLSKKPASKAVAAALTLETDDDWLTFDGEELLWSPRGNLSASELDLSSLEKLLGPTTIRTKNTIDRLTAKHLG